MVSIVENKEINDILISAIVLSVAFGIFLNGGILGISNFSLNTLITAIIVVSTSFILHELAHRFLARRYGFYAEYKMWPQGLLLALITSLFGFIFAAPGAVMIHPKADLWGASKTLTRRRIGLIALVGPLTNIAFIGIFGAAFLIFPSRIFAVGLIINIVLAFFNMIPIAILDGAKVFGWDKRVWAAVFVPLLVLYFIISGFVSL